MYFAGKYFPHPIKKLFIGVGLILILALGIVFPLSQIEKKTDVNLSGQVNAAFSPSFDGTSVNGPSLSLPSSTKILIDSSEPQAIQKAARDLQRDMQKVLGVQPTIVNNVSDLNGASGIIITFQGSQTAVFRDATLTGEESHQYAVRTVDTVSHAVIQGADMRGTLFAIYMFSDKVVGIPPLWYWSEWKPEPKTSLDIAENSGVRVTTPQVRYRIWFLNNQDLFGSWTPSVDKYDIIFETMLRLKINTWYIGETVGEYGGGWHDKAKAANERGLLLLVNSLAQFRRWDTYWSSIKGTSVPSLTLANKAKFDEFWKYSIQYVRDNNFDVIWGLGFRGSGDEAFWDAMADAPTTDSARGDIEEQMIVKQMQLVRTVMGQDHPRMSLILWNELTDLTEKGALQIPTDNDLIWTFGNDIRDHFPRGDARNYTIPTTQPYGFYMNLQFYSTGAHLAEAEGPWKTWKNFSMIAARKPGAQVDMVMLNVGNVREFLITAASASEMMWNIGSYNVDTGVQKIFSRYFTPALSTQLTTTYKALLNAYWKQKGADISGYDRQYIFHDLRIKEAATIQLSKIKSKTRVLNPFDNNRLRIDYAYNNASSQVGAVMLGSQASYKSFESVSTTINGYLPQIPTDKQSFYKDVFVTPVKFMESAYKTLYLITRSHFTVSSNINDSVCYLKDAQTEAAKLPVALNEAKHGQFSTWYNGEDLFGVQDLRDQISTTLSVLPSVTCTSSVPTPTPTRTVVSTPTPTPTNTPTPTPTRTTSPTPTPTPTVVPGTTTLIVPAYTSISGLSSSNVKDGKRTVIRAMKSMTLKQIACYGCGSGTNFILRKSSSTFSLGTQILTTSVQGITSSWGYANVNTQLVGGGYYILEFTPAVVPVYYGSASPTYPDIQFLRYATTNAPSWKVGSWQIRVTYER